MENKKSEKVGLFEGLPIMLKAEIEKRKKDKSVILFDVIVFVIAFIFARRHIIFGSYPLAIAFVAVLPTGVWLALIGAVIGALSLGKSGVIYSVITIIVVFLRVLISGTDKNGEGRVIFSEPLVLKISAAVIGAFVGAIYEILLGSLTLKSILYSVSGVLLSALFTFLFSGVFHSRISFSDFLFSRRKLFDNKKTDKEKIEDYIFQASLALLIFLISIALKGYDFFGISPAYIFSSIITLVITRRFGVYRGIAIGFISSLGVSSVYSVCFALVGLGTGFLFSQGLTYALVGGGALLVFWGAYAGGVVGMLSVLPEYVTGALLSTPVLTKLESVNVAREHCDEKNSTAEDMVFANAVAYKNVDGGGVGRLQNSFFDLASSLRTLGTGEGEAAYTEYRDIVIEATSHFCSTCHHCDGCKSENPAPCAEIIDLIATKLYKKERIFAEDKALVPKYCHNSNVLFEEILQAVGHFEEEKYKMRKMNNLADFYELVGKLMSEAVLNNQNEKKIDTVSTDKLMEVFANNGLYDGTVKVYGERKKHLIGAGEDKDGSLIGSQKLKKDIENSLGVRLGKADYYRKGDVALIECPTEAIFSVEFSTIGRCSSKETVSGDSTISFESYDGKFYSLISDGMGSGNLAHRISNFTCEYLSALLNSSVKKSTALHLLNHILRSKDEECPVTVDLFELDLMTGDAVFYKCGAAPSYIKRENSIFRIRSETAPIGLMKSIDAERMRVEIKDGDYVIMLSDGASQPSEDTTWLLELLNKPAPSDVAEYAEAILDEAVKNRSSDDDISVSVVKLVKRI